MASPSLCFVAIKIANENSNPTYEYACQETPNEHFNGVWQACLQGPVVTEFSSMQCCDSEVEDGCNKHLRPPLPTLYRNITTSRDPTTTTPITTPSARPRSGTGMEQRHNQSIPI